MEMTNDKPLCDSFKKGKVPLLFFGTCGKVSLPRGKSSSKEGKRNSYIPKEQPKLIYNNILYYLRNC